MNPSGKQRCSILYDKRFDRLALLLADFGLMFLKSLLSEEKDYASVKTSTLHSRGKFLHINNQL